ncbi:hypothetical protein BKA70DRAFT_480304 [Coprinopsis sp. MPI-PUGE-AT-0042]|nr:hypothetical protein BKA70DRAFT_480304 [Coprinopsis sp. MPI-PUGE-AT-0042]
MQSLFSAAPALYNCLLFPVSSVYYGGYLPLPRLRFAYQSYRRLLTTCWHHGPELDHAFPVNPPVWSNLRPSRRPVNPKKARHVVPPTAFAYLLILSFLIVHASQTG